MLKRLVLCTKSAHWSLSNKARKYIFNCSSPDTSYFFMKKKPKYSTYMFKIYWMRTRMRWVYALSKPLTLTTSSTTTEAIILKILCKNSILPYIYNILLAIKVWQLRDKHKPSIYQAAEKFSMNLWHNLPTGLAVFIKFIVTQFCSNEFHVCNNDFKNKIKAITMTFMNRKTW